MNAYEQCPILTTKSFILRLVSTEDSDALFDCYGDEEAVRFMNDDNCDFGFLMHSREQMRQTIDYWLDFYEKRGFIRFSVTDRESGKAVGTIEGFGGETGVLRVDMARQYEKEKFLRELFDAATDNFKEIFANEYLVTKAVPEAVERRKALNACGWEYISEYKGYPEYYCVKI